MSLRLTFPLLLAVYLVLFAYQETVKQQEHVELQPAPPVALLKTAGYLKQLGAEMLYIKAAVFLGGRDPETPPDSYAAVLANHFDAMTALHPRLLDIYYLSESSLSWIGAQYTQRANAILAQGGIYRPELWVIPFFIGFNQFYYLHNFNDASRTLRTTSLKEGAPVWLGHLSALLAARGGNILGGLAWLRAMAATEDDATVRTRYEIEIKEFEKAAHVLSAISSYQQKYSRPPAELKNLVPEFIDAIPILGEGYELDYEAPELYMRKKHVG
ncbi:MAG TPA: hypothetical protein VKA31_06130 [Mariprofundaceae bacterium]|nr:hypothetical protein [Mariprofundaceae bacterium]